VNKTKKKGKANEFLKRMEMYAEEKESNKRKLEETEHNYSFKPQLLSKSKYKSTRNKSSISNVLSKSLNRSISSLHTQGPSSSFNFTQTNSSNAVFAFN